MEARDHDVIVIPHEIMQQIDEENQRIASDLEDVLSSLWVVLNITKLNARFQEQTDVFGNQTNFVCVGSESCVYKDLSSSEEEAFLGVCRKPNECLKFLASVAM
ncbi:hypothetical protein DY000_02018036 [Brassica cretica]|uniref:Uncharacterized protein n=1 Tax=Brassica cretica TaxID=69181 RepID=A0ABQ7CRE5_BRACR|nr:hypothetical protein DY000_02018036 [Brassica cretica]